MAEGEITRAERDIAMAEVIDLLEVVEQPASCWRCDRLERWT